MNGAASMILAIRRPRLPINGEMSLEELYRAHAADVSRWATWLGRPPVEPEDVVQEVFLIVRARLGDFHGDSFLPWLFRITSNVVANQRRRAWLRALWTSRSAAAEQGIPEEQWPSAQLETRERVAALHQMLSRLPERQRQVLILFELEGMGGDEIANLLGVPAATVRVWLHRGRAALSRRVSSIVERGTP
jgi:RNA polymerase sigma-70 factor, ECF subfamily